MTSHLRSVFTLLTLTLFLQGCGKKEEAPPPAPPVVLVTEAKPDNAPIFGEAIATLEGSTNTPIQAQVTGYLIKQGYTEGAVIRAGDLLFEIDSRPFQDALDKANVNLAAALTQLLKAKQDIDSDASLLKSGAVSQKDYQNAVQNGQAAQSRVAAAQASVTTARINLSETKITAPLGGFAGKAQPGVGDLISPGTPLTTISTVDPIRADFAMPAQAYLDHAGQIAKWSVLAPGDRPDSFELVLGDGSVYPEKGKFSSVSQPSPTSNGACAVEALFPNPGRVLRPGQYAKVRGVMGNSSGAVLIPRQAVSRLQGASQVDVVKPDNTVEIRNVTLGDQAGSSWIVTDGLKPGERIVVVGLEKYQPGAKVTTQPYVPDATVPPVPVTPNPQ